MRWRVGLARALRKSWVAALSGSGSCGHVANYRGPKDYAGQRVMVVGASNAAVQVGYELAEVATTTFGGPRAGEVRAADPGRTRHAPLAP